MAGGASENGGGSPWSIPSYMVPGRQSEGVSEAIRNLEIVPRGGSPSAGPPPSSPPPAGEVAPPPAPTPLVRRDVAGNGDLGAEDYARMSWGEYLPIVGGNIGPSALQMLKDVGTAVINPIDTATTVGRLGYGAASKGIDAASQGLGFGPVFNPETRAEREAVVNALASDYASRYGQDFWERLAEDPASYLADIGTVATLGAGSASKAGLVGRTGQTVRAAELAGNLDPAQLAMSALSRAGRALPEGIRSPVRSTLTGLQSVTTGVPTSFLNMAYDVGRGRTTPEQRTAFLDALRRSGGNLSTDIVDTLRAGLDEAEEAASQSYLTSQATAFARTQPVDMTGPRTAYDELNALMNGRNTVLALDPAYPETDIRAAERAMQQFQYVLNHPDPAAHTIQELDRLKKNLNILSQQIRNPALQGRVSELASSLVSAMSEVDPAYGQMMQGWRQYRRELNNIMKDFGSDRMSDASRLRRIERAARGDQAEDMFSAIERTPSGANIRYSLAGEAMRSILPDRLRSAIAAAGGPALAAAQFGPQVLQHPAVIATGALGAAVASPRIAANLQRGLGTAARAVRGLYDTAAPTALSPAATNLASQIGEGQAVEEERMGRRAGGRVGVSHDALADQLVSAAERAKKGISRGTEALLGMHDDHIASALEVANRSI